MPVLWKKESFIWLSLASSAVHSAKRKRGLKDLVLLPLGAVVWLLVRTMGADPSLRGEGGPS